MRVFPNELAAKMDITTAMGMRVAEACPDPART